MEKINDIEETYYQYNLVKNIPFFHKFILNRDNSIITEYNSNYYVLLLVNNSRFTNPIIINSYGEVNWRKIWQEKSDYIESYYEHIRIQNPLVNESFDYYLGLLEFAIFYLGEDSYYGEIYIQQKKYDNDINNPLNVVVDFKERNFAEYLKYLFISNEYKNIDMHNLIRKNKDNYNFDLVIARVIYPNYYFDLLDDIIDNDVDENILIDVIKRSDSFENYINYLMNEISLIYPIKKIPFMRF